jgi:tetratricopeptide (TPR) repeat protein
MMFSTRAFSGSDVLAIATMDYHAGRFAEAERGCRAALKLLPDDANVLYLLGLAEVQLGGVEAGLARIEAAAAQDPGRVDRVCGFAAALVRLQRLDEAVAVLGRAVRRAPDNSDAYRQLVGASRALAERPARRDSAAAAAATADDRSVSAVVCSIDPQKAKRIREHYATLFSGRHFEIVQIDDACSLSEGYNRGFAKTSGDVVIFSHDDIEIASPDLPARLVRHLSTHDIVGVAGTSRLVGTNWNSAGWPWLHGCVAHGEHGGNSFFFHCFGPPPKMAVQAVDGLFIAAKREVCEAIPFSADTFDGFHLYDLDFSYRAFLAGFRIAIAWDIPIIHASSGRLDAAWQNYAQKFAVKYRAQNIVHLPPPPVSWPVVQFADRTHMLAFHRAMATAQGADTV